LQLREDGFQVHDATCPLVKRAHQALERLVAEGRHPVVIGQAGHVEVRGLVGDYDDYTVILSEDDLSQLDSVIARGGRLGVVAQTTQPLHTVLEMVEVVRRRYPGADIQFIDTVCQPTKDRQDAMQRLVDECEVVVVVGGPESNNTRKLTEMARAHGRRAYQVSGAAELRREWFDGLQCVGITAGTSTPEPVIREVHAWLESL
jgi:4-hydroxy-3-methylbut-2-enyl diphosphate reductase